VLGYQTLAARNGPEALALLAQPGGPPADLLLTDVVMPESISGRQLAHALRSEKPDLKVIYTSGYSTELLGPEFEQERNHAFLPKPYAPDRLASTVADFLQRVPSGLN
jgi:CheY-like chemotaxis protein